MKKNKILVTGAKGFVGAEIVAFLRREYERVFTLENEKTEKNEKNEKTVNLGGKTKSDVFIADITNKNALRRLDEIEALDAIVHAAGLAHQFGATKREVFQKVNVAGTENVLLLARRLGVKHFILISSVSVYGHSRISGNGAGEVNKGVGEDAECAPEGFYAESKLDAENAARRFCEDAGIRLTILRPATVVGEHDPGNFLRLIRAIDRRRFVWIGTGVNYKSLVHREDVARACSAVLDADGAGTEIFNIAANFLQMKEAVRIVAEKLNKKIPNFFVPAAVAEQAFRFNSRFFGFERVKRWEKTVSKWLADDAYSPEKIKKMHGFAAQISAEEAVGREVEWYIAGRDRKAAGDDKIRR